MIEDVKPKVVQQAYKVFLPPRFSQQAIEEKKQEAVFRGNVALEKASAHLTREPVELAPALKEVKNACLALSGLNNSSSKQEHARLQRAIVESLENISQIAKSKGNSNLLLAAIEVARHYKLASHSEKLEVFSKELAESKAKKMQMLGPLMAEKEAQRDKLRHMQGYDSDTDVELVPSNQSSVARILRRQSIMVDGTQASATTIFRPGGGEENIKGHEIMRMVHECVQDKLPEKAETRRGPLSLRGGHEWLQHAGRFSAMTLRDDLQKPKSALKYSQREADIRLISDTNPSVKIKVAGTDMELKKEENTERLFLGPKDFKYKDILEERQKVPLEDHVMAECMLWKLKNGSAPEDFYDMVLSKENHDYLNFLNCLMFGVETSRNNNSFATGLMTLELIAAGKMTFQDAFGRSELGGDYPMASLETGKNNLSKHQDIKFRNNHSFIDERLDSQHNAVAIKEASITIRWLELREVLPPNPPDTPKLDLVDRIKQETSELMQKHFA